MIDARSVLALIPARGGSSRIPRKNIRPLAGHPLIWYSITQGKASRYIDRVIVSTDDAEIAAVASTFGAEIPFLRPISLATDTTQDYPILEHALIWLRDHESYLPEIIVQLRPTSPLRTVSDIDRAIALLVAHPEADSVRTVARAKRSPYKMYTLDSVGFLQPLLMLHGISESFNLPEQVLPPVYEHVGYVDVMWHRTLLERRVASGRSLAMILEDAYGGINTPQDWEWYEFLLQRRPPISF